jgi:hypothetical protein
MTRLSDDKKWEVYSVYLCETYFCSDSRLDAPALEALLQDLGVTLEQIERVIAGEEKVEPSQPAQPAQPA